MISVTGCIVQSNDLLKIIWTNQIACFMLADVILQVPALQICERKREMAVSRFVFVSDEEVSRFVEENETKNTARKTVQDVALLKSFLSEKILKEPEELPRAPLQLDASLKELILSVRKRDGSDYEPSSLRYLVASIERYLKQKSYGYSIINSIEFAGT